MIHRKEYADRIVNTEVWVSGILNRKWRGRDIDLWVNNWYVVDWGFDYANSC